MLCPKNTPGERCSCDTTTRSAPLMTNVPFSVRLGDLYHGYFFRDEKTGKRGNSTPFTRRSDQLIGLLQSRLPNNRIEYLWNNVSKIGCGGTDFGKSCRKPTSSSDPRRTISCSLSSSIFIALKYFVKLLFYCTQALLCS